MSLRAVALAVLLFVSSALSACGQKGPLFLPEADGTVITREAGDASPTAPPPTIPEGRAQDETADPAPRVPNP